VFLKLLAIIVFATAVATTLLGLRHRQLQIAHETVNLHLRIDKGRQALWDLQTKIAEKLEPRALWSTIDEAPVQLEPSVPAGVAADGNEPR